MTATEKPGESIPDNKLHLPEISRTLINLILILLLISGCVGFGMYKMDQKVNTVISSNKVIQEFALKSSEQTVLLKLIDEKFGTKISVRSKIQLTQTIYSLSTVKKIPLNLICGLIEVESNWNPEAKSEANAKGLMQTIPAYSRSYLRNERIEYKEDILYDPSVSAIVGISMLSDFHLANIEAEKEKEDSWEISLHNYFWGPANTSILFGKKDGKYNVPNMAYPMRVLEASKKYKELGL